MKNLPFLLLLLLPTIIVAQNNRLSAAEFNRKSSRKDAIVVDVRTPGEYASGHLPNAVLIDFNQPDFMQKMQQYNTSTELLIYCASGNRSSRALLQLTKAGYSRVYDLTGGIAAWRSAGYKIQ
jgi:phage shock protein E